MTTKTILPSDIQFKVTARDWRDALRVAAEPLLAAGHITPDYVAGMIASVEQLGPYIVIAPGLALGHARPSASVKDTSFAIASLATPVKFGNAANDPVDLVIILASISADDHLCLMRKMVEFLNQAANLDRLRQGTSRADAIAIATAINGEGAL